MSSFANSSYSLISGKNTNFGNSDNQVVKYIDISSNYRNRTQYPNPNDFIIPINYPNRNNGNFNPVDPISEAIPYTASNKTITTNTTSLGSTTTDIWLDGSEPSINNFYINNYLQIPTYGYTFFSKIINYDENNKIATVQTPFSGAPASGLNYFIRKALPAFQTTVGGIPTFSSFVLIGGVSQDNAYVNNYVFFSSGLNTGLSFLITGYNGTTKVLTVSPQMPNIPVVGDNIDICSFTRDNASTLTINSVQSGNTTGNNYYELELLNLSIPNTLLDVSIGGNITNYPFVYVEFYNEGKNLNNQIMISNNPTTSKAIFKVPINNYNGTISFFNFIDCNMRHIIRFEPDQDLRFRILLPDGTTLSYIKKDNLSPSVVNSLIQTSATFSLRRITFRN
jgi:hypothetical protein